MLSVDHFSESISAQKASELFKAAVRTVDISISSYCNRKCSYCPNTIADRQSNKNFMSDGLFLNILRQLCRIDYSGSIRLNRYNEPLADKDYALARIRSVKQFLPKSQIAIYTNGDYLNKQYVEELRDAGVSSIIATAHTADMIDSTSERFGRLEKHLNRIGLPFEYTKVNEATGERVALVDCGGDIEFTFGVYDFYSRDQNGMLKMSDRGRTLPVTRNYVRDTPCWTTFFEMHIEWDGRLLPCCEIQPDAYEHDRYVLGRLTESSDMFLDWCGAGYVSWRKSMFCYGAKSDPCGTCTIGALAQNDEAELRPLVENWRKVLQIN
jgi:hypothetical protein